MSIIKVQNLKKYFGPTKAVDGISFEVQKGEILGFLGPNGAGKTTTIRCMIDILRPDFGSIKILGKDSKEQASNLKKDIGFIPADTHLYDNWTGVEHIQFVRSLHNDVEFPNELIKKLDFDTTKKVEDLSSGNKQKLELIISMMHKPKVLILDEPTTGLDPILQDVILDVLADEAKKGTTIFMSSHNLPEVERICNRVLILKDGKIVTEEKISELKKKRLYSVYVYFEKQTTKKQLQENGIKISKDLGDGFMLNVKGDIRPVLKKLNSMPLKDIEIRHADLEKIFLEFYK
ncbi:ABC transporter ATP-binding protein [Candidatus Dojkabacteria bacterium]|nr:ABC transporter ATP-binding protein [Candidatus Dojkabacteria bacterium]